MKHSAGSMNTMRTSANFAEASFSCASRTSDNSMIAILDAIIMASILITLILSVLSLFVSVVVVVSVVSILLAVLLICTGFRTPKRRRTAFL